MTFVHLSFPALRATDGSYKLNTDFRLSRFGENPGVGSNVVYTKDDGPDCPDECIKIAGPIDVSVDILVGEISVLNDSSVSLR